jgi:AraC family transcriptional activator of pobA
MQPFRIKTISEYHKLAGLPKPKHPLISVINMEAIKNPSIERPKRVVFDFYSIALKRHSNAKCKYGQEAYDFDEGIMFFTSPGQVLGIEGNNKEEWQVSGWILFVHPDLLWNTPLAKTIKRYEYFDYSVNEALHLSEKEELMMVGILNHLKQEYHSNIDKFSQNVIVSQIEVLLNYAGRYYHRQFITRKKANHQILSKLEDLLSNYFDGQDLSEKGLPTVQTIANELNVSPDYLGNMLKVMSGKNALQHIQDKIVEKAKEKLSTT